MKEIFILHSKPWEAAFRIAANAVATVTIIGVGVMLNSPAMQWAGFLSLIGLAFAMNKAKPMTIKEARARLDEIEKEVGL